ncbi:MAG TPA: ATP-binding protein [Polyangia bacterium]|jgi:PAS domain S-box-containing protein|nr:ATP-binding protein [Polyangia bacterium]
MKPRPRILVVEDEAIVAADLAGMLGDLGYDVCGPVAVGEQAIALAAKEQPALVLMDIKLKGPLDGIEAAERIHEQQGTPTIFLTSYSDELTLSRAKAIAPLSYLLKPIAERDLRIAIEVALERSKFEQTLAERERWLGAILDQIPQPLLLTMPERTTIRLNQAAQRFTRRDVAEVTEGEAATLFIARRPRGGALPWDEMPLARSLRRGDTVVGEELELQTREGHWVPFQACAAPVYDAAGQLCGGVAVFEDITALKELERHRIEWAAVVAHDLRRPLGIISLAANLLNTSAGGNEPTRRTTLDRIRRSAERLDRMIRDLSDSSCIEASQLQLKLVEVDLSELIRRVVTSAQPLADGRRIVLRVAEDACRMRVDPVRIEQVLENLLSNAVKYGDPGSDIVVECEQRDPGVWISVLNRGRGISPEEVETLFRRFGRPSSTKASDIPGLGLGLYICKGLVEAHGGRIWVESTPGEITAFRVALPLHAEDTVQEPSFPSPGAGAPIGIG